VIYYEDLQVGQSLRFGEHRVTYEDVDAYLKLCLPIEQPGADLDRVSSWYSGAMSIRLLAELAKSEPAAGMWIDFNVGQAKWGHELIQVGDKLSIELSIKKLLGQSRMDPRFGEAWIEVRLFALGVRDGGTWGDYYNTDPELFEILNFETRMRARLQP
jgi:hypothetical protein